MVHWYGETTETIVNGKRVETYFCCYLSDKEHLDTEEIVTWENLESIYSKYRFSLPFGIWEFKKGRRISFFNREHPFPFEKGYQRDIKEWKTPNVDIKIRRTYKIHDVIKSLDDVLKWHNTELATQYLKERGINICPIGNV